MASLLSPVEPGLGWTPCPGAEHLRGVLVLNPGGPGLDGLLTPAALAGQADHDPATAYPGGPAMADRLRASLVTVVDAGGHGHYGTNPCVTARVDDHLVRGEPPPSRSDCPGPPRPDPARVAGTPLDEQVRAAPRVSG